MSDSPRPRILIADSDPANCSIVCTFLQSLSCLFDTVQDGREAIFRAMALRPDCIFLDTDLPGLNGFEVCRALKENPDTGDVPVLIITSKEDRTTKLKALEAGACDALSRPLDAAEVMLRTQNLLRGRRHQDSVWQRVNHLTAELSAARREIESHGELKKSYLDTIHRLTIVAEFKDEASVQHVKRVGMCSSHIAQELGWSDDKVEMIQYAAPMHDIGKIAIPSSILLKPGELTPEELALVKTHTIMGGNILKGSTSQHIQMAERIAVNHHEQWDGGGYPRGLKEEDIPIEGRIVALADMYDSLRSTRPYKPPYDYVRAYRILTEGNERSSGHRFDPRILEIFKDTHKTFEQIYEYYGDKPPVLT